MKSKEIAITFVSMKDMVVDGFTEASDPKLLKVFRAIIELHSTGNQRMTE